MQRAILALSVSLALLSPAATENADQRVVPAAAKASSFAPSNSVPKERASEPMTPVQKALQRNTTLASAVAERLPAGTDLRTASQGFRTLEHFVAVVNVSDNLEISFYELKARMLIEGISLEEAIRELRPASNAAYELRRAQQGATTTIRACR